MASLNKLARNFRFATRGKWQSNNINLVVKKIGQAIDPQITWQVAPVAQCQVSPIKIEIRTRNNRTWPRPRDHACKLRYTRRSTEHPIGGHFRDGVDE